MSVAKNHFCLDCNKSLKDYRSSRCKSCSNSFKGKESGFKDGNIPWNKNKKLPYQIWNKGIKMEMVTGDKHYAWKGDQAGYKALHEWVVKNLGKAFWCTWCFSMVNIEWANLSHQYKRDINDWIQLCVKCHRNYDSNKNRTMAKDIFEFNKTTNSFGRRVGL